MWRKLFIVCMLGAASCISVHAGSTAPLSEATASRALSALSASRNEEASEPKPASRRIALLIGNANYANDPLANPLNDVRALSRLLASQGFDIMRYENVTAARMKGALRLFNERLRAGGTGLFYFSGHGFQVGNTTLLAPVDTDSRSPARLLTNSLDLRTVLASMSTPRPGKKNLIILDTCLNNPFRTGRTDAGSMPKPPEDTLIAYATHPGAFAGDGASHGIYTDELMKSLRVPGLDVTEVFKRVAASVSRMTGQRQMPQMVSTLASETVLATTSLPTASLLRNDTPVIALRSRAILPKDSAEQYELAFWDSIKDSDHAADYEAYLQAYPNGRFAALAKARIARLKAAATKNGTPPAPAAKVPERPRPAPHPAKKEKAPKEPPAQTQPPAAVTTTPAPAPPAAQGKAGAEIKDCADCPPLIALPGGSFTMGSNSGDPSEKPAHRVAIASPFAIGKYEVTIAQWNACVQAGGCQKPGTDAKGAPDTPVRDVSWDDAQQYVKWLSKVSGKPYRLPTEAEWEYAARGGTSTQFWWGEKMQTGKADCKECGPPWTESGPVAVGSFAANPFGLHDVNGSVWEWVEDCWHSSYKGAPTNGHAWETPGCRERVIRGGSWREGASYMPSSTRFKYAASVRDGQNGFRVARDAK